MQAKTCCVILKLRGGHILVRRDEVKINKKMTLLMTETSSEVCRLCKDSLEDVGIEVSICARNGAVAYSELVRLKPDAVLLDVFMPGLDAVSLKNKYSRNFPDSKTVFYATGPFQNEDIEREVIESGFSFYFLKPFDPLILAQILLKKAGIRGGSSVSVPKHKDEAMVVELLKDIGVPAHIKGYRYLKEAILMVVNEPELINSVTKELYPNIATEFKTMATRVERAIRHAIEVAWDRGDVETLDFYFGSTINSLRGKPTNSEFIAMLSERIVLERAKNAHI